MKTWKNYFIIVFFIMIAIVQGCVNVQKSTRSEAETVVAELKNFDELVQYIGVGACAIGLPNDPYIKDLFPNITKKREYFVHQIYYTKKDGFLYCSILNDEKPPKIILTISKFSSSRYSEKTK